MTGPFYVLQKEKQPVQKMTVAQVQSSKADTCRGNMFSLLGMSPSDFVGAETWEKSLLYVFFLFKRKQSA